MLSVELILAARQHTFYFARIFILDHNCPMHKASSLIQYNKAMYIIFSLRALSFMSITVYKKKSPSCKYNKIKIEPQPQAVLFGRWEVRGVGVRGSIAYILTNPSRHGLTSVPVCYAFTDSHSSHLPHSNNTAYEQNGGT